VSVGADGTLVIDVTDTDTNVLTIGSDRRPGVLANRFEKLSPQEAEEVEEALSGALSLLQKVSDILEGDNEREPAVSGLVASVRSLRDARMPQPKD
jgi:ABC-type Na+ efflux pump permease subunit